MKIINQSQKIFLKSNFLFDKKKYFSILNGILIQKYNKNPKTVSVFKLSDKQRNVINE